MRATRTIPAMLLLLAVAVGLLTMHTLGHAGLPSAEAMPAHGVGPAVKPMNKVSSSMDVAAIVAADLPTPADMPMGALAMCVAVLGGLGALAVMSLLARRRRRLWPPAGHGGMTPLAEAVRGPPGTHLGLALAELSVLRN
jgi:hypothetical protein